MVIELRKASFTCGVCGRRWPTSYRSKTKWITDSMLAAAKSRGVSPADVCMKCKAPPPNDGGSGGTPVLKAA